MGKSKFWILSLVALVACGEPHRLVVEDRADLREAAWEAVDIVEAWAGCPIWDRAEGRDRDWRGLFPPRGTTTVEYNPGRTVPEAIDGRSVRGALPRGRVYLRHTDNKAVIAHELFHQLGIGHDDAGVMRKSGVGNAVLQDVLRSTPDSTLEAVQAFCKR